ncbi:MAG: NAD(+) diphosphatase [Cellvibrio sp.]|uniref:NAD(+) diphosphatase n=1 Tax=Cellvibrio sp. TaxID=1965322 RepID=UPI0031AC971F
MSAGFDLSSFEFHASSVTPVASRNRRFIIVGATQSYRCDQLLCDAQGQLFIADDSGAAELNLPISSEHYLGVLAGDDLWVRVLEQGELPANHQWLGLRSQLEILSVDAFQLAGRALQVAQWFYDHRFCGRCGQPTMQDQIDRAKVCSSCELRFYPRISPCMIVLVARGEELLLAHHHRASRVMYTTLAGFVEVGESVEDCIKREIMEEVGVSVGKLEYFRSQPWPFPNQLMLGFFAEYEAGEIKIDPTEIVDAKWFRYDQLPQVPAKATVAGQLIAHYVEHLRQINPHHKQ